MKLGFLIIDMQPVHLQEAEKKIIDRACEYVNYVAGMLRSKDHVIIHIQDIEGMDESNREAFQTIPEIPIKENDLVVTKEYSNSFWNTELEGILREQDVELLIIAGNAAEHCVLFTYNGASERGFKPVILQNGIVSSHSEAITATYRDRNVISHPVISYMVKQ
ncbi:cysteine hydrolase family protein [Paenibacillus albus]|uniref:Isochorismatase family protein n=1 Tax=Paenibacillus albus TaxID=2495582 RepID=A0A3S9AB99_9BACL|nr:isochorismatase family protein [Paenibacillus albus]AZN42936.1 isochorismatase family protein [Paenibacillus albus]